MLPGAQVRLDLLRQGANLLQRDMLSRRPVLLQWDVLRDSLQHTKRLLPLQRDHLQGCRDLHGEL
jgi:hypothetical protein